MKRCGQQGGLTVRHEGFLRHPPPWSRGVPLCRHLRSRGGLTTHPFPGACVSTSMQPDTGPSLSARRKWRLQSGRLLSPPRVSASPERDGAP